MRTSVGGDVFGDGMGYGGGGGAWWGFAFIVFIIFAIIIAFAWLSGNKRENHGWENFLPLLGMMKGKFGGDDGGHCHTELVKDQAKDTGQIIHNTDMRTYDLKSSIDHNTGVVEKTINSFRNEQMEEKIADLRAALAAEKTANRIEHTHSDLKREILGMKENLCRPGWFEHSGCKG